MSRSTLARLHYLGAMTARGRLVRWAGAQSNPDLYKFGVLLMFIGAVPYWKARSGGWLDPGEEFRWVLVAATALPLFCAAIGGLLGWRRGRAARKGGLAVFLAGWWFAAAAVVLTVLRGLVLLGLVIAFQAEQ